MKLPRGRRAHEGARPAWRRRLAWLWVLAFRRLHHQEIAAALSDLDATERLITEPYTKAVEQLGSDKAPVRLGGLYTLEGLAQENPSHRQTIVNVICAYLRMPFSPTAPASKADPEAAEDQKEPSTENETETDGIGSSWQQEKQVRLTAQRILGEHLRDDKAKDQQSTDPPSSRFWNNIRLDFTGATLIDFNLVNGVMADANFHEAAFTGDASFGGATFSGVARFGGATFSGDARFGGATFSGVAGFRGATFSGVAGFRWATFSGVAGFGGVAFHGDAWFDKAAFSRSASFGEATFHGDARFGEATFGGDAWFDKATFSRSAWFDEATFGGDAWFDKATFSGDAWFGEATFSADGDALHFEQARILSPGASHMWPTGWRLADADGGGYTVVRTNDDGGS